MERFVPCFATGCIGVGGGTSVKGRELGAASGRGPAMASGCACINPLREHVPATRVHPRCASQTAQTICAQDASEVTCVSVPCHAKAAS